MRSIAITIEVLSTLVQALRLAPHAIALAIFAEAIQHIVEIKLGMYVSRDAFVLLQGHPERVFFGSFKAISLVIASYIIASKLTCTFGPFPEGKSFIRHFLRKMWDPRNQLGGIVALLALCAPLVALHYGLSYLAIGSVHAYIWLALDSLLIGAIALVIGTTIWATDVDKEVLDSSDGM